MIYLEDVKKGRFFRNVTDLSLQRAANNLSIAIDQIVSPYHDLSSNLKAVAHPSYIPRPPANFLH